MGLIHELLPKVMADIGAITKDQRNTQGHGYNFRGVDDALNHVNPVLIKHGVTLSVKTHDVRDEGWDRDAANGVQRVYRVTMYMDVTFWAADGSNMVNTTFGEAIDYGGDKGSNKAMAAAFKYALFLGLCIPVEPGVIDDSDHDHRDEGGKAPRPAAGKRSAKGNDGATMYERAGAAIRDCQTLDELDKIVKHIDKCVTDGTFVKGEGDVLKGIANTRAEMLKK